MFNKEYSQVNINNELVEAITKADLNKIKELFSKSIHHL